MSLESDIKSLLASLAGGRIYPDTMPDKPTFPCIVYQQVGGKAVEYVAGKVANKDNARLQVMVWSKTRLEASTIARAARVLIVEGAMKGKTYAAPVSLYEEPLKLYGNRTDYSVWYTP